MWRCAGVSKRASTGRSRMRWRRMRCPLQRLLASDAVSRRAVAGGMACAVRARESSTSPTRRRHACCWSSPATARAPTSCSASITTPSTMCRWRSLPRNSKDAARWRSPGRARQYAGTGCRPRARGVGLGRLDRVAERWAEALVAAGEGSRRRAGAPGGSSGGRAGQRLALPVSAAVHAACRALAERTSVSPFSAALQAFAEVLGAELGVDDLLVGVALAGRSRLEMQGLVGCFVNLLPLAVGLRPEQSVEWRLRRVTAMICWNCSNTRTCPRMRDPGPAPARRQRPADPHRLRRAQRSGGPGGGCRGARRSRLHPGAWRAPRPDAVAGRPAAGLAGRSGPGSARSSTCTASSACTRPGSGACWRMPANLSRNACRRRAATLPDDPEPPTENSDGTNSSQSHRSRLRPAAQSQPAQRRGAGAAPGGGARRPAAADPRHRLPACPWPTGFASRASPCTTT